MGYAQLYGYIDERGRKGPLGYAQLYGYIDEQGREGHLSHGAYVLVRILR